MKLERLKMIQRLVAEEIKEAEERSVRQATVHPKTGIDVLEDLVRRELLSVKPIMVEVPEGADVDELIERVSKGLEKAVLSIDKPKKEEPTEFQKKAMSLYNAYMYRLNEVSKDLKRRKDRGAEDIKCVISPTMVLKEGFDPEEVLEGLVNKLMEGK